MAYGNALIELFSYHVAATRLIAPGEGEHGFSIRSTTPMTPGGFLMMKQAIREDGRPIVALMFDVGGRLPHLDKVWIMMRSTDPAAIARGEDLTLLVDCKLWAPVGDGPILIVAPSLFGGHFAASADCLRLEHRPGMPSRQLTAGMHRAKARMARAARAGNMTPREDTALLIAA